MNEEGVEGGDEARWVLKVRLVQVMWMEAEMVLVLVRRDISLKVSYQPVHIH